MGNSQSTQTSTTVQKQSTQTSDKIIAAIDFGTTYSGYAFCFDSDRQTIFTATHGNILSDDRVPTVLLLNPDNTFNSFGVAAEDAYANLVIDNRYHSYKLFENFKMSLYSKEKLEKDMTIEDTTGRAMKAVDVFSVVIRHLKGLIIKSIKESKAGNTDSTEDKIHWMLTIPAIWSDSARQFMRIAAKGAGIPEKRLRLVLEPEAAAMFCKDTLLHVVQGGNVTTLPTGTNYILADLGGGTADICVHEIIEGGNIRELYRSTGGAFGGTDVKEKYVDFLKEVFRPYVINIFRENEKYDYLCLMRNFEEAKRKFDHEIENVVVDLPQSLVNMLEYMDLENSVRKTKHSNYIRVKENKLICKRELFELFFKPSLYEGIIPKLQYIRNNCLCANIEILLTVGGYSESQYLREIIKKEMREMNVILVQQPRLAVLKGAVMMGFQPECVIERRSRFTYGFAVAVPFCKGIHPEDLKFEREGELLCNLIFEKLFEKDSFLKYGQRFKVTTNTRRLETKFETALVSLYRSNQCNPKYCISSEDCIQVGRIEIKAPKDGWKEHVKMENFLIVGETEFKVLAKDGSTGREFEASVDFL